MIKEKSSIQHFSPEKKNYSKDHTIHNGQSLGPNGQISSLNAISNIAFRSISQNKDVHDSGKEAHATLNIQIDQKKNLESGPQVLYNNKSTKVSPKKHSLPFETGKSGSRNVNQQYGKVSLATQQQRLLPSLIKKDNAPDKKYVQIQLRNNQIQSKLQSVNPNNDK